MNTSPNDVMRIMLEQQQIAEDQKHRNHRDHADEWALGHGMEQGTMAMVCNGVFSAFELTVVSLTHQEVGDDPETEYIDGVPCVRSTDAAFTAALEMTILSAFRWGYETARQIR